MSTPANLAEYIQTGKFYKNVVEDGADIVIVVDYDGTILYNNPSVNETLNYESGYLVGKSFFEFIHPDHLLDLKKKFRKVVKHPFVDNVEFLILCGDNTYKYFEFNSINLKQKENIEGLVLDCRDISQRKRDAEELLRAKRAKEQFLAKMSHEIRTPINGIAGMVNLLSETKVSPEQSKFINAIKNSTDNLKVIVNDILDFSVIESGKLKFEQIGFSLEHQVKSIVDTFTYNAQEKGLKLKHKINKKANRIVIGDPVRLNQILINLISNSLKFTHVGSIELNINVKEVNDPAILIEFTVKDTGVGISPEKLDHIFDTFRQADESITRKYGGTGLGLAIVKQLIELQDGQISVKSVENEGTEFTFFIPYQLGTETDLKVESVKVDSAKVSGQGILSGVRVLLVEDNDINRFYASSILKKWDCEVEVAENGYIALEKLKKSSYDIVLMDIQMPVMDGFEATRFIRESFKGAKSKIPIIALTANAIKGDNEKCIEAGMNGYVSKPFLPEELQNSILEFISPETIINNGDRKPAEDNTPVDKIVDLSYLKTVSGGDENFMREMIEIFLSQAPTSITGMKSSLENKDWEGLAYTAHKIKPSITFMGIEAMKEVILKIEELAKEERDLDQIPILLEKFSKQCDLAYNQLEKTLEKEF